MFIFDPNVYSLALWNFYGLKFGDNLCFECFFLLWIQLVVDFSRNFVPCGYVSKPVVDATEWEFLVTFISEPLLNLFGAFEFAVS